MPPSSGRTYLFFGLCAALIGLAVAATVALSAHAAPATVVEHFVAPIVEPVMPQPANVFNKSRIHVLVLGRDYDYNDRDIEYSSQSRSDIIMAFTVDFPTRRITELSVPRDTAVTMPDGGREKINAALAEGGVPKAKAVISSYLGVTFDRTVLLRIDSTKQLIDTIGGIDVPVKDTIDYDDSWGHLHIHVTPGMHHMGGETAVSYARFRHDSCGDPCRIQRQQDVLHAIANKVRGDKLNDLLNAQALMAIVHDNVTTDFSGRELASLAWAFRDIDPKAIATAQVPYTGDVTLSDGGDALVPDDAAKTALVKHLMLDSFVAKADVKDVPPVVRNPGR
jgi:polyisoprenyl-teichoic acid--peptidoglycan teichoic acid transferase